MKDSGGSVPRHRSAGAAALVLLVVLWGAPPAVLMMSMSSAKEQQSVSVSGRTPEVVRVGSRTLDGTRAVIVTARLGPAPEILSGRAGLVTRIRIAEGADVVSGTALLDVDGHTLRAFSEETPLFRDLAFGDEGPDVTSLSHFLVAVGALDPSAVDDRIGPRIRSAVMTFQRDSGWETDGVFRPRYVLFAPRDFGAVVEVAASVGQRLDDSSLIVRGAAHPVALDVESSEQGRRERPASSRFVLRAGDLEVPLAAWPPAPADTDAVWAALTEAAGRGDVTQTPTKAGEGAEVRFEGAERAYERPFVVGTVPSSAVYTAASGRSCVFVSGSSAGWKARGARAREVGAEADQGEPGQTLVTATLVAATVARDAEMVGKKLKSTCA